MLVRKDPALFSVTAQGGMLAAPTLSSAPEYRLRALGSVLARINLPATQDNNITTFPAVSSKVENEKGNLLVNPIQAVLPSEINQQEITVFEADKQVHQERQVYEALPPFAPLMQHTDNRTHTVVSYLQRPQLITSKIWNSDLKVHDKVIEDLVIPETLFSDMIKAKLDGFTSFKATAVIRVQVQSQPFMAGRLLLAAVPMPQLIGYRTEWILQNISRLQALHHVQMDISKETEVSLRIPFISPMNSFDLITQLFSWARVRLSVYSPFNSASATQVQLLVWGHFEDVELGAPTSSKFAEFQDNSFNYLSHKLPIQQSGEVGVVNAPLPTQVSAQQQVAAMNQEATGSISEYSVIGDKFRKIGGVAQRGWDDLGNALGLKSVTNIFKGLSKFGTGLVGGLFDIFGFSKPRTMEPGSSVLVRPAEFFGTTDGVDHSHVLALVNNNKIDILPSLGGTSADELSFDFLKKIPIFVSNFEYNNTSADAGPAVLFKTFVAPTYYIPGGDLNVYPVGGVVGESGYKGFTHQQPINLHYIISPFEYWTGSLVYTFRFVKTDYHSGRVEIAYHPFGASYDRPDYCYRTIVDLREKTEITLSVPYISPTPWKKIETTFDPLEDQEWKDVANYCTGRLTVRALTSLMAGNAIVSKKIDVLVEVRAGDDFQVSCPVKSAYLPICINQQTPVKQQSGRVHATVGNSETRTAAVEGQQAPSITGSDLDCQRPDVQPFCAGEVFSNFRALTRRFAFVKSLGLVNVAILNPLDFLRSPIALKRKGTEQNAGSTDTTWQFSSDLYVSPLTFVGSMFAFYRGSLRLKFYLDSQDDDLIGIRIDGKAAILSEAANVSPSYMSPLGLEQPKQKKLAEVQVPYYGNTFMSSAWPHALRVLDDKPLGQILIGRSSAKDVPAIDIYDTPAAQVYVAAAAGDDLDFKIFLGSPPCIQREKLLEGKPGRGAKLFFNGNWDVDPTSHVAKYDYEGYKWDDFQNVSIEDLQIPKEDKFPLDKGAIGPAYTTYV